MAESRKWRVRGDVPRSTRVMRRRKPRKKVNVVCYPEMLTRAAWTGNDNTFQIPCPIVYADTAGADAAAKRDCLAIAYSDYVVADNQYGAASNQALTWGVQNGWMALTLFGTQNSCSMNYINFIANGKDTDLTSPSQQIYVKGIRLELIYNPWENADLRTVYDGDAKEHKYIEYHSAALRLQAWIHNTPMKGAESGDVEPLKRAHMPCMDRIYQTEYDWNNHQIDYKYALHTFWGMKKLRKRGDQQPYGVCHGLLGVDDRDTDQWHDYCTLPWHKLWGARMRQLPGKACAKAYVDQGNPGDDVTSYYPDIPVSGQWNVGIRKVRHFWIPVNRIFKRINEDYINWDQEIVLMATTDDDHLIYSAVQLGDGTHQPHVHGSISMANGETINLTGWHFKYRLYYTELL